MGQDRPGAASVARRWRPRAHRGTNDTQARPGGRPQKAAKPLKQGQDEPAWAKVPRGRRHQSPQRHQGRPSQAPRSPPGGQRAPTRGSADPPRCKRSPPKDIGGRNDFTLRLSDSQEATCEKPLVFHTFQGLGEARRANLTNHWFLHHKRGVTLAAPARNPYF